MPPRWIKPGDERWSSSQARSQTMQEVAEHLKCPNCKRRSGLKEFDHIGGYRRLRSVRRRCRWCGYEDIVVSPVDGDDLVTVIHEGKRDSHAKY